MFFSFLLFSAIFQPSSAMSLSASTSFDASPAPGEPSILDEAVHVYDVSADCGASPDGTGLNVITDRGLAAEDAVHTSAQRAACYTQSGSRIGVFGLGATHYEVDWSSTLATPYTFCFIAATSDPGVLQVVFDNVTASGAGRCLAVNRGGVGADRGWQAYGGVYDGGEGIDPTAEEFYSVCVLMDGASSEWSQNGSTPVGINPGTNNADSIVIGARGNTYSSPLLGALKLIAVFEGDRMADVVPLAAPGGELGGDR